MQVVFLLVLFIFGIYITFFKTKRLMAFILGTGPLSVGGFSIGEFDLSSIWLLFLILMITFAFIIRKRQTKFKFEIYEKAYLIFLAWCIFMWILSPQPLYGARMFLKLLYPFLAILLAHTYIETDSDRKYVLTWVVRIASLSVILTGGVTHFLLRPIAVFGRYFFTGWATFADFTAMMAILLLICWKVSKKIKINIQIVLVLLFLSPVLYGIRTGIAAMGAGITVVYLFSENIAKSLPKIFLVYLAAGFALFIIPEAKQYMFFNPDQVDSWEIIKDPAKLNFDIIDTHGRTAMWKNAMDILFYPNPVQGSGLGTTQQLFYTGIYQKARVTHNEFVRILCDLGIIGLILYGVYVFSCLLVAWRTFRTAGGNYIKIFSLFALAAIPALMVAMYFDNLLDYVLYAGQYPFAFLAMTINRNK